MFMTIMTTLLVVNIFMLKNTKMTNKLDDVFYSLFNLTNKKPTKLLEHKKPFILSDLSKELRNLDKIVSIENAKIDVNKLESIIISKNDIRYIKEINNISSASEFEYAIRIKENISHAEWDKPSMRNFNYIKQLKEVVDAYSFMYTLYVMLKAYQDKVKRSNRPTQFLRTLNEADSILSSFAFMAKDSSISTNKSSTNYLKVRLNELKVKSTKIAKYMEITGLKDVITIGKYNPEALKKQNLYIEPVDTTTNTESSRIDSLLHEINNKVNRLNNTISKSMQTHCKGLSDLYKSTDDTSSQAEIIRQLEVVSGFLDEQIEINVLPGSKAYIDKQLSTSSHYISGVIENGNWVE